MIAGLVAVADKLEADQVWHLVDVGGWPLVAYCGDVAPEPMRRQVRPLRQLPAGVSWCQTCRRLELSTRPST